MQNKLFEKISDSVVDSSQKEWKSADVIISVLGASVDYELKFHYFDDTIESEFMEEDGTLSNLLRQYHDQMNESNPKHWNKLLFKLDSSGKFETEFEWDQALQDEYEKNSHL